MTEDEIRAECLAWLRGDHWPPNDESWDGLRARVRADGHAWWNAISELATSAATIEVTQSLAWGPLAVLIEQTGSAWDPRFAAAAHEDPKLASLIFDAMDNMRSAYEAYKLMGREQTIETYRNYHARHSDWDFWAWEAGRAVVERHDDEAWSLILDLVRGATPALLVDVGCGPLEDLIGYVGDACVDRVEAEAARNPEFREALSYVWIWDDVSEPVFDRIERAAGTPLTKPES